jgi:hypothetical protein
MTNAYRILIGKHDKNGKIGDLRANTGVYEERKSVGAVVVTCLMIGSSG